MIMEPRHDEFNDYVNGFTVDDENILPIFDQTPDLADGYRFKDEHLDLSFLELPYTAPDCNPGASSLSTGVPEQVDSPDEFNDVVFKFINTILVEENTEGKELTFYDPLDLLATERSLYEALGETHPSLSQPPLPLGPNVEYPEEIFLGSSSEYVTNSSTSYSNSTPPDWPGGDVLDSKSSETQTHSLENPSFWSSGSITSVTNDVSGTIDAMINAQMVQNIFTDSESIKQFNKGMEEASKFLPSSKPLVIDLDKYDLPSDSSEPPQEVVVKVEKVKRGKSSTNGYRGRKHYQSEENGYEEERSSKQSAVYVEETELSDMFDKVLLCTDTKGQPITSFKEPPSLTDLKSQQNGSNNGRKVPLQGQTTSEAVDIRTLLVNCAQSVTADDRRTANEQLKQIRQHASTFGDASQRLAHVFAIALEARLDGTGSQLCAAKTTTRISAAEKLKAYQVYLSACPFKKISIFFANKMILEASSSSSTVHIVDFGIGYGFQWPILIKHLSERPGGPPKLRITGIELPQPGFRPAERLDETGRHLTNYCERFKVPFEYNTIATQNWETIKIEDLKLQRHEFLAVNTLFRFKNLLDETVIVESPRDRVLKLIRDMRPDMFLHAVVNGSYSAPFFVTRFREALFHYSSLFDMFDATIDRENDHRLNFEKEFYGREAINVIACEGAERVERPETYRQWQGRIARAGFKLKPLNQEIVSKLRSKVRDGYHKDFVFDEDGKWVLQGWKGRILCASACWVPA